MNELQTDQSYSFSYDETSFLSYQKIPELKSGCSYSKEGDLYCLEDSLLTL